MHNFTTLAGREPARMTVPLDPVGPIRVYHTTDTLHGMHDPIFRRSSSLMPAALLGIVADVFA